MRCATPAFVGDEGVTGDRVGRDGTVCVCVFCVFVAPTA